jgi:PIN domain nuclease of toxin-antitoxin system
MADVVFDASALLAHIGREVGSGGIDELAVEALMSAVNLAEVFSKLAERGLSQDQADTIVYRYRLRVVPLDEELARQTGALRSATKSLGLSLGDRACLALALRERLPVVTGDKSWARLDLGVTIRVFR